MKNEVIAISAVIIAWSLFAWWFGHALNMNEEYSKVWGKENYELINEATARQIWDQIPEIKAYLSWEEAPANPSDNVPAEVITTWGVNSSVDLAPLVAKAWINEDDFYSCVNSDEMLAQYLSDTAEGNSFGLTWTPGNLIINTKTKKYVTIKFHMDMLTL